MNELQAPGRVAMSRRERDVSVVMRGVLSGERTQVEVARLLKSVRQIDQKQLRELEKDVKAIDELGSH